MGVVISTHLPPPVMMDRTADLRWVTHSHVLFGGRLFREGPGQHELGFEDRPNPFNDSVKGRRHPRNGRVLHKALDVSDGAAGVALIPASVEVLGDFPKL